MDCPKAICQSCGTTHYGWGLKQKKNCECGGKLMMLSPYKPIIDFIRAGAAGERTAVMERKIADARAAEAVVRRALQSRYGGKIMSLSFSKTRYSVAGEREIWNVEGTLVYREGWFRKHKMKFTFQVKPGSGKIEGFQLAS